MKSPAMSSYHRMIWIESGYSPQADSLRQKFTGKERDAESGLDYFLARYYSNAQGRFTSADEPFAD